MKKIVSLFTLLLCFAAMAIGASFTNPPPDERDDGVSLCAYNFNTSSEAQPEQNGATGTSYLLPFEVPATNLGRDEGEVFKEANTTATTRLYWPTGNSKASRCGLESISYTTKFIAPTSYSINWPTANSKASCSTIDLCSCSELENAEQLQSALGYFGVYGCPAWMNAVLVSSSETESTYDVDGVANSADGPVNVGVRIHCTLHWGQSPNNGPPYAYTTCTWDLEMFRWDDFYGGYISR